MGGLKPVGGEPSPGVRGSNAGTGAGGNVDEPPIGLGCCPAAPWPKGLAGGPAGTGPGPPGGKIGDGPWATRLGEPGPPGPWPSPLGGRANGGRLNPPGAAEGGGPKPTGGA